MLHTSINRSVSGMNLSGNDLCVGRMSCGRRASYKFYIKQKLCIYKAIKVDQVLSLVGLQRKVCTEQMWSLSMSSDRNGCHSERFMPALVMLDRRLLCIAVKGIRTEHDSEQQPGAFVFLQHVPV